MRLARVLIPAAALAMLLPAATLVAAQVPQSDGDTLSQVCTAMNASTDYQCSLRPTTTTAPATTLPPDTTTAPPTTTTTVAPTTTTVAPTTTTVAAPSASFTVDPISGAAPLHVSVTIAVARADWWQMNWSGGNPTPVGTVHPATDTAVGHDYPDPGTYTLVLHAWRDADAAEVFTAPQSVTVSSPPTTTTTVAPTTTTVTPTGTLGASYGGLSMPWEQTVGLSDAAMNKQADEMKTLGVGWHRGDYPWSQSETTKGTFVWSTVDKFVLADRARGIKSLPILYFTPPWARAAGTDDKYPPTNPLDYGNWVGQACGHLSTLGVTWVELWNEENLNVFFKPMATNADRDKYLALAKDAATKCHAAAPTMKVLAGGLSTADSVFQAGNSAGTTGNGLYSSMDYYGQKGLYQVVDGIGWHPYLDDYFPGQEAAGWARWSGGSIRDTLAILDKYAPGKNLQLWNTESAAPRSSNSQADQATKAREAFEGFLTGGFAAPYRARLGPFFWFCLRDRNIAGNGGVSDLSREDSFGLFTNDWLTKFPAYDAVKTALARPLT